MFLDDDVHLILKMTLPKGFKPKDTKKSKIEDSKSSNNNNNINTNSNQLKVAKATADDFTNKQENKIVADNIPPKEEVTVDHISTDEGTATVTTVTTTPTPEGEVLSETELKVPLQEKEKEVLSETELKVMSPSSSSPHDSQSPSFPPLEKEAELSASMSSKSTQNDLENKKEGEKEAMQYITDNKVLLDETKNNIRRATDEARKDIPRYTQAANEYQEQTIQTAREIADNFLESQKEIINSLQSAWLPQIDAANRVFVSSWLSPTRIIEIYSRIVSSFVDNAIIATRLVNNTIFASMEAFNTSMMQAKDNTKDISRMGVNISRTFEQTLNSTNNTIRGDPDQIPKEDVPGQVEKIVSQQGGVEGQRKEVNVESYSKTASLGQILKDLEFPSNKARIVEFVQLRNPQGDILSSLQKIEDRQYQNVSEVAKAAGLVY
jgi:hypothetical protein